jgi:hypothetical protein
MFKNVIKIYTLYVYESHRAIIRQRIIKKSTALCTLSIVLLGYIVLIINFGVTCSSNLIVVVLCPIRCATPVVVFLVLNTQWYIGVVKSETAHSPALNTVFV